MIRIKLVKWLASGAIALSALPAIGLAKHASHVSAASPDAISTSVTPLATAEKSETPKAAKSKTKHHRKHKAAHAKTKKSHKATKKHAKKKHHAK